MGEFDSVWRRIVITARRPLKILRPFKEILIILFATKLLVFLLGFGANYIMDDGRLSALSILMDQFNRWDAPHYIHIAENWYASVGEPGLFIVFFPLYPILIRLTTFNHHYVNLSALIVSNVASIAAAILLFKLVRLDFKRDVAVRSVLYLSIFPTAYFLSAIYTESLFLALTIGCFYFGIRGKWPIAGSLGFLASLTRITGLALFPALAFEYLSQRGWRLRNVKANSLWLALIPAGFGIYLLINHQVYGDLLAFMVVQREHWFQRLAPPWEGLLGAWKDSMWRDPIGAFMIGYNQIAFALLGLFATVWGYSRLRTSYPVYMYLVWLMSTSTSFLISVPRYVMAMFPMFILFGLIDRGWLKLVIATVFMVLLGMFTVMFSIGWWAF